MSPGMLLIGGAVAVVAFLFFSKGIARVLSSVIGAVLAVGIVVWAYGRYGDNPDGLITDITMLGETVGGYVVAFLDTALAKISEFLTGTVDSL